MATLKSLGKWGLLDIETTGVDAGQDDIIDVGFLTFDGGKLSKTYESLVRTDFKLSPFITNLTGITDSMLAKAPLLENVEKEFHELDDHYLIAHNAQFESSFLSSIFERLKIAPISSELNLDFGDSLPFLALTHPGRSKLGLESFILDYNLAEKELHRGYQDSVDLLKVMLSTVWKLQDNKKAYGSIRKSLKNIPGYWFSKFIDLKREDLITIGSQIDLDLEDHFKINFNEVDSFEKSEKNEVFIEKNRDFSSSGIKDIFRSEDDIRSIRGFYDYRETQEELALKIGQSFSNGIHSLVQAPTGTGKSLGYLIPSILFALKKKKKVLLSTGTKILQSQLLDKDLKLAMEILGKDVQDLRYTKLIGTSNHLCRAKFDHHEAGQADLLTNVFVDSFIEAYCEILFEHNANSSYGNMITMEDVPYALKRVFEPLDDTLKDLKVEHKSCLGARCPHVKNCSYFVGLDEAKKSDVIIGNHALTFLWPQSIERPGYIIFDEAHKIEETATSALSIVVEMAKLESFFKSKEGGSSGIGAMFYLAGLQEINIEHDFRTSLYENLKTAANHCVAIGMFIEKVAVSKKRYSSEYWNEVDFSFEYPTSLETSLINEVNHLRNCIEVLRKSLEPFFMKFEGMEYNDSGSISAWSYFKSYFHQIEDYEVSLNILLSKDEDFCRSIKFHESYGSEFHSIPIDIGALVHQKILATSDAVVFTSATLGNMNGTKGKVNIEWLTGYLYCEQTKRFKDGLYLDPVFDYENQAKVLLASDVPPIYQDEYIESIFKEIIPVIEKINGRSLLLFSSYKRFNLARDILLEKLRGKIEVFYQGMGGQIVEQFKESKSAILLGLESFGEGIDIPGSNLEFLYIDKVPDLGQELIYNKRKDFFDRKFGSSFSEYFMATRARKLQQKLGRLIRSKNDKGIIFITDPRIGRWKDRTVNEFNKMLEPYQIEKVSLKDSREKIEGYFDL